MLRVFSSNPGDKLGLGATQECVEEIRAKCGKAVALEGDELDNFRQNIIPAELVSKRLPKLFNAVNHALDKEQVRVRGLQDKCLQSGREDDDYINAAYAHNSHNKRFLEIVSKSFDSDVPCKYWDADLVVLKKMSK